jgi:hypothetical protein
MKKLLTIAALAGATALSFGQGQITFNNTATTQISTNSAVSGPATGPTAGALGGFVYALFAAPSTVNSQTGVNDVNWTFTGVYATNSAGVGRLVGGQPTLPSPYASGTTFNFLVRGWSSNVGGQDWNSVRVYMTGIQAGGNASGNGQYFGTSGIATVLVGGNPLPSATLFGTAPGTTIQGFTLGLLPVPEPSTFALAGLGAAAMLIFRRRKA